MTKVKIYRVLTLILLLLLIASVTLAQNKIPVSVLSSGGEKSASAEFILSSTVGESFIGKTINATNQQNVGFWYVYKQSTITVVEEEQELLPTEFKLEQNFPNPFNPATTIKYAVPIKSNVLIKIYNIVGEEVAKLVNEEKDQGWYSLVFESSGLASGIYIYRMQAGTYVNTKKMILVK
jgi:hypothetical protein